MSPQSQILLDASSHPRLFYWFGEMSPAEMDAWFQAGCLEEEAVPSDLRALWAATGGGDYFESETLLGPRGDVALGDEVMSANRWLWDRGLPRHYLVFSRGAFFGAVDMRTGDYVHVEEGTWLARTTFTTLDAWYRGAPRREFAMRYGLTADEE